MGYVGGYTLDLYCDGPEHRKLVGYEPGAPSMSGDTFTECARRARAIGWIVKKHGYGRENGYSLCPTCRQHAKESRKATP